MTLTAFMKLPDVEGESVRVGHEREIDVFDIQWALGRDLRTRAGTGRVRGRPGVGPLAVWKWDDAASPHLALALLLGKSFPEAAIMLRTPSNDMDLDDLTITLSNATVSHYEIVGADGDPAVLQERLDLVFEAANIRHTGQAAGHSSGNGHEIGHDIGARA
ncbi:Hcp family type VI secretion system effector [Rhodovulum visakhapatnamense]|uniref:Type VI secretion system secreted protein Hcp n=1 Tax=Rhodovulum visakhapatnamense TaxID=364297 RepID=A0A4R8G210_9RHOB|nr:type VI secretion system tube protein Hcp [Rhodovulum visakhapatnamense]TDX33821.1 type VI secretion system secreted protein Hcp [Rhodovulum visakhapatnamense]